MHKTYSTKIIKCTQINPQIFTIIYNLECNKNSKPINLATCIKNTPILMHLKILIIHLHKLVLTIMPSRDHPNHNQFNKTYSKMIDPGLKPSLLPTRAIGTKSSNQ